MRLAFFLAAATVSGSVLCQPVWKQEPRSVFGVTLGASISPEIPTCSGDPLALNHRRSTSLCWRRDSAGWTVLEGTPNIGFEHSTVLTMAGDQVLQIALNFQNYQFDDAIAVLKERYGPPTRAEVTDFITRGGGRFPSRTLTWSGPNTVLVAIERNSTLDVAQIAFLDVRLYSKVEQLKQEAAKQAAGNL